ncbi:hypothetical protein H7J88_15290 [Mycolicibacterium flavescens]|uniref:Low molecular weight antigen MTB12-like C-terminal domain-containing protein n=1 Tax=Mycolicibacterium flavescens TaxID=1776 RepID=A0A1E3RKC3_MYCFV|nr:hypothetical protein [Mycolicibacterium flavescens]MCV7281006.1 hypothetical protein [Mycolicibacterium flavescens]ODQ90309.1 hypothetical protein BHQ18_09580 [Mycolicibacterium flavescens]
MPRTTTRAVVLSAVAIAAALGLSACGDDPAPAPAAPATPAPITRPPTVTAAEPSVPVAPLPPPNALTDVLARMADGAVPGADKLDVIEDATPADGDSMDKFTTALRDGGYAPVTFEATDLTWADGQKGVVLAVVTIRTANPQAGDFTFPMEFRLADDHWQLSRRTADSLLQIGEASPTPAPNPPPTPTP